MTRTVRRIATSRRVGLGLATTVLGAAALSGCGVSDQEIHPGAAAVLDGSRIDSSEVDAAVPGTCAYLVGEGQSVPLFIVRQQVLVTYLQEAAVTAVADDLDVVVDQGAEVDLGDAAEGLSEDQVTAAQDYLRAQQYVSNGLLALSSKVPTDGASTATTGDPNAAVADLQNRAYAAFVAPWLAEHRAEVNPSFGLAIDDQGTVVPAADGLSVAASDEAVTAVLNYEGSDEEIQSQLDALVAQLPANQVCGTPTPPTPEVQAPQQPQVTANPRPTS